MMHLLLALVLAPVLNDKIDLNPSNLAFKAPSGGPNPSPQTVTLRNKDKGDNLQWTASDDAAWLTLSATSGDLPPSGSQSVSASVDVAGLAPGTHVATIRVQDQEDSGSSRSVSVSLEVAAVPRLSLSPASLAFDVPAGGPNPPAQALTVANSGTGTLAWSASDDAGWLALSPTSGSLGGGGSQALSAQVDVAGLAAGTYSATITVDAPGATDAPRTLGVTLNVRVVPALSASPASLTFDAAPAAGAPPPQTLTIRNTGGGTMGWTAADDAAWLSAAPASGSLGAGESQTVQVSVSASGLSEGAHLGSLTVTAAGASGSPQGVAVTLNVSARPKVALSPAQADFASEAGADPPPTAISLTNAGGGTLAWTADDDADWLSVSPASGSLGAVQSIPLTLSVRAAGLAPGTYAAVLTVGDPASSNTAQTAYVTLAVAPAAPFDDQSAGSCGQLGLEALLPLLLLRRLRRRDRR